MTVLGSITDILVTEFGVSFLPASLRAVLGWAGRGEEEVAEKQRVPTATAGSSQRLTLTKEGEVGGAPESRQPLRRAMCGDGGVQSPQLCSVNSLHLGY